MVWVPAGKALLLFKVLVQRVSIVAINLYLLETWKFGAISQLAKLVNALVCAGSLLSKLIAREV